MESFFPTESEAPALYDFPKSEKDILKENEEDFGMRPWHFLKT